MTDAPREQAPDNPFDLTGRVALVTGAGGDIGRAIAFALGSAGAYVGLHYHTSRREAEETLTSLRRIGRDGLPLHADLTVVPEAESLVERLVAEKGRLDILVNNAGAVLERSRLEDCTIELWREAFDVNVHSAFVVTRKAIPHLRASGAGAIVNNLSLSVQTGGADGAGPYAAAKGALQVFTRTLARELAPEVRTNAVMPGVIESRHHDMYTTPERMAQYRRETPLGRNGTPEEVAQAVLFLISDAARFVNGAIMDINGGRFLR